MSISSCSWCPECPMSHLSACQGHMEHSTCPQSVACNAMVVRGAFSVGTNTKGINLVPQTWLGQVMAALVLTKWGRLLTCPAPSSRDLSARLPCCGINWPLLFSCTRIWISYPTERGGGTHTDNSNKKCSPPWTFCYSNTKWTKSSLLTY